VRLLVIPICTGRATYHIAGIASPWYERSISSSP
jgi:hypothetical protein